jgi:hypothetical protein
MVLVGKSKETDHSEDLGIDGRILKLILKKQDWRAWTGGHGLEGMDFIHLAQDRDTCWTVMNMVITFRFNTMQAIS